jgi:hypothetical protein
MLIAARLLAWVDVSGRMRTALALFSGALFLLHPLQTESVAYVASRSEVLSVLFYYAAFAVFIYSNRDSMSLARAVAVVALFGAAAATKEHTLTLPLLIVLTDFFWHRGGLRKNAFLYGLLALVCAAGGVVVWKILLAANTAGFHMADLSPASYFFTQCRVIWIYVRMFLLPFGQNVDPDIPISAGLLDHGAIFGLIALLAVTAAAWIYRKRWPLASFGVFVSLRLTRERDRALGLRGIEQLDRSPRHHGADGVLVDELGVPVAPQQDREVVEPGDDALELDAVDQEDGHRGLVLAHMVQEHVLHILRFFSGHSRILLVVFAVFYGLSSSVRLPGGRGTTA